VSETLFPAPALEDFARRIFLAMGAPEPVAATVAGHLIGANLAGHDSHGLLRIPQYVAEADRGDLLPGATAEVVVARGAIGMVDAGRGFGHSAAALAMAWAAERCTQSGIAAAAVRRANHIGRLGEYAELAAARGVIGIATVGVVGAGGVTPFGGRGRYLGTNPWAIGVPAAGEPMIYDAATSAVAEGKLRVARSIGATLPEGAIVDPDGRPSVNPEDYYAGGALLPLGGSLAGHKGYGLALAAGLIGGLAMVDDEDATTGGTASTPAAHGWLAGVFVLAIDPEWFGGAERYRMAVAGALQGVRRQPPADGVAEILIPGDPERRSRERRSREGIPVPDAVWAELTAIAERYGVGVPGPGGPAAG
jgi:LDH2 family malate/lactate/ureidoglycolate dehydrogenase